jgi:hypothetical protein
MCILVPGNVPRFIAALNVPHIILNDAILKKIFMGKLGYPARQNQASSAGFPTLLFSFKIFYRKSCVERAYSHNEKYTSRKKILYIFWSSHCCRHSTVQGGLSLLPLLFWSYTLVTLHLYFDIHSCLGLRDLGLFPLALQSFFNRSGRLFTRHCVV